MENSSNIQDVNQHVTDLLIKELKQGRIPWRRVWTMSGIPMNPITKMPYLGINQLLLGALGYLTNFFLTFNQIKELKAKVKPGEKAYSIIYWKKGETADSKATLHTFGVFNIDQCTGLPDIEIPDLPEKPHNICHDFIENMPKKPHIHHDGSSPEYIGASDVIVMPLFKSFPGKDQYYYTLFTQLVISVGGETRLNRKEVTEKHSFDSKQYALRELSGEIGAWQLASIAGISIPQPEYRQEYIKSWIEKLERDKFLVINAANKAQQAVDFILNRYNAMSAVEGEELVQSTVSDTDTKL